MAAKFQESGESEIIDNLLALIDGNMKARLDEFYLADDLPKFAAMTLGDTSVFTSYPLLVLGPERMASEETNDGWYLNQDLRVGLGFIVKASTIDGAIRLAMKYVRALKAVFRSASAADLLPTSAQILDHVIDIDHRYLRHGNKGTEFTQPVEFELKIKFGEK